MSNSLIIANSVELLSGGVPSTLPLGAGATYYLSPGWSMGAPQPTVDITGQLMIDGERPFGRRASNRTISLPVTILAPSKTTLAAALEALLMLIDADQWTLTWVRDGGSMPIIFDCFRAQASVVTYSIPYQNALACQVALTFDALPYGRSVTQQQVAFPAPLPGTPPAPPAPLVLDQFTTISSGALWSQSQTCVVGPNTGYWDPVAGGQPDGRNSPLVYSNTFSSPVSLAGLSGLSFWLGLGSRYWWNLECQGTTRLSIAVTLTDSNGQTLSFWASKNTHVANSLTNPAWTLISAAIPQGNATFSYGSVVTLQITITNRARTPELRYVVAWLDTITATPPARIASAPALRGSAYVLAGVQGTSHAPISVQAQGTAVPGTVSTLTAAGVSSYTVPASTVYLKVECIGGGGAGAGLTGAGIGGGGGGGEYAQEPAFAASAGMVIPCNVGAGGSQGASPVDGQGTFFGPAPSGTQLVTANGGKSAAQNSATGAAGGTGSSNTVHYPGGTGRTASSSLGGGGGSSASAAGAGNTPVGTTTATLSGSGNWSVPAGVTQITVICIGGGGGGGRGGSGNGGGGGGGESATQTFTVTPSSSIPYSVGGGGAAASSNDTPGSAGSATTFGPVPGPGTTLTAHGGGAGPSATHSVAGGAAGTGSAAPVHYNGGQGGGTSPYSGSGGSSAGYTAMGNAGSSSSTAGGAAPVGGGAGGKSPGSGSGSGHAGYAPGGGGAGTYVGGVTAGAGANGTIVITYPGPTNAGATAPSGGGAGGVGGASANTAGSAGTAPGGAGGGGNSGGSAENGGAGAAGQIVITPYQLPTFKTLILHRPRPQANAALMPFIAVGNGNDTPNNGTEYPVPPLNAPAPLNSNSTFTTTVAPWTAYGNATLSWSASGWAPDPSALFTGNGSTANPGIRSELVPVAPGGYYTAVASLYSPQGWSNCQVGINWYDSSSSFISASTSPSVNVAAGVTAGTVASCSAAQAPATAAYGQIFVQMTGTPGGTVQLFAGAAPLSASPSPGRFGSTYSIVLVAKSWNTPANSRSITVTIKQYEYIGGPSNTSAQATVTVVPNTQVTNGVVVVGEVVLPYKDIPPENLAAYFTVLVNDTNTSDRFLDVLLLDTAGQTVIINEPTTGYPTYYVDEPDANALLGRHMGSATDRSAAVSVLDACIPAGALTVEPGDSTLLAYSPDAGAPAIGVSYFPRWFIDRAY